MKNLVFTFVGLAPHFPAQFASRPGLTRSPSRAPRAARCAPTALRQWPPRGDRTPAPPAGWRSCGSHRPLASLKLPPAPRAPARPARPPIFHFLRHSALSQQQRAGSSIDAEQAPSPARSPPRNHHLQLALSSAFTSPSYSISPSSRRTQGSGPI